MSDRTERTTTGPQPTVALPPWSRNTVYVLTIIVGGFTLGASGFELYSLARNAGFAIGVALALPIGLDAGAAGAAVLWVVGPQGSSLRKQGKITTLVLVAVSAVCNGVSILAVPMRTVVGEQEMAVVSAGFVTFVAFLLAFVFPIVAARAVHLLISVRDNATGDETPRVDDNDWDEFAELDITEDQFDAIMEHGEPATIEPDMAAIEAPRTDPATAQFTAPEPVREDETVARLRALRAEHGWRPAADERAALAIGWPKYRAARDTIETDTSKPHPTTRAHESTSAPPT